jgi:RHS repeat-associated protein
MVTDINASVKQQILYSPMGEVITEYNAYWKIDTIPSFRFNGKIFDEESGMYYYSARYYNPPTFISRDPLFEKYFWCSPYAMTLNNPVKYIDPDGCKVVISYQDPGQKNSQKLYYHKGELYKDKKYTDVYYGNNKFALDVQSDLNNIASKGGELKNRLNTLVDSKNTHTITAGDKNQMAVPNEAMEGAKTGSTTYYARDSKNVSQSRSSLVHELLGHGYSADQGNMKEGTETRVGPTYLDQINAINIQNVYNKKSGLPLRTTDGEKRDIDISKYLNLNPINE